MGINKKKKSLERAKVAGQRRAIIEEFESWAGDIQNDPDHRAHELLAELHEKPVISRTQIEGRSIVVIKMGPTGEYKFNAEDVHVVVDYSTGIAKISFNLADLEERA